MQFGNSQSLILLILVAFKTHICFLKRFRVEVHQELVHGFELDYLFVSKSPQFFVFVVRAVKVLQKAVILFVNFFVRQLSQLFV